jgi:PhnB protein
MKMPFGAKPYIGIGAEFGGARTAIAWYVKVFGAKVKSAYESEDGKMIHAEVEVGNSSLYVSDAWPGVTKTPADLGGTPITLFIQYESGSNEVFDLAVKEGAKVVDGKEYKEQPWGWTAGTVQDPFGYVWTVGEDMKKWSDEELAEKMGTKNVYSEF